MTILNCQFPRSTESTDISTTYRSDRGTWGIIETQKATLRALDAVG